MLKTHLLPIVFFFLAGTGLLVPGEPKTPQRASRLDAHGDQLPEGVIARLGTVRFRQSGQIHSVAFSPDGKKVATGGADNLVRVWDKATGKEVLRLTGHPAAVDFVAFGNRLRACSATTRAPQGEISCDTRRGAEAEEKLTELAETVIHIEAEESDGEEEEPEKAPPKKQTGKAGP